ncbi:MAG TPA: UbiD family decarboxylase [Saprospiraceae bacterium]|nr:UbiD family decarboxylase [Saprospiraceae bacterium]
MSYSSLESCLLDLEKQSELIRIKEEICPQGELAEIQRRVYSNQGPALLFERVKGSSFRVATNVYGTAKRSEYIFRDSIESLEHLIRLKIDPMSFLTQPVKSLKAIGLGLHSYPKKISSSDLINHECKISDLPQIKSWPNDGGAFVTLPQVISFPPSSIQLSLSNIGMYRIQLSGNNYLQDQEIGLHYQLHRGIGIHQSMYQKTEAPFRISIGIGGPPSHALASIFPLPEGMSEILFTGLLGKRRYRYYWHNNFFVPADVDFCITGVVDKNNLKPEGPFGDHLGYYSLTHNFPVVLVDHVFHKKNAIFHATVVGRPPQEDSSFGYLIHQITKEIGKTEFPGIREIHAVDVAGVHPLLLAIGSERYMPFRNQKPEEILIQANHLLGKGQTSLAKYLWISSNVDNSDLSTHDVNSFFDYILQRIDWRYDIHFQTQTTIDTLDYSGEGWNSGSKAIIACHRPIQRKLLKEIPSDLFLSQQAIIAFALKQPGILLLQIDSFLNYTNTKFQINELGTLINKKYHNQIPLIVIVDDVDFCMRDYSNFLWVCFTRSNPSHDIHGIEEFINNKHWGCPNTLIIDARVKSHHAPELNVDPEVSKRVDSIIFNNSELKKLCQ